VAKSPGPCGSFSLLWCFVVSVTLCLLVYLALIIWSLFFGLQNRPLVGEITRLRWNHCLRSGFLNFESTFREVAANNATDSAKNYLLRVVALTGATQLDDGYVLDVGTVRFQVGERFVLRLRGGTNDKSPYEQTCYFCPNKAMPTAERIATVLLMLKNNPALFDAWATRYTLAFKADGQMFKK
jgi:hypothetical protein